MFTKNINDKDSFIKQANEAREKRTMEKKRFFSAIKIQAFYRGFRARKEFVNNLEYFKFKKKIYIYTSFFIFIKY